MFILAIPILGILVACVLQLVARTVRRCCEERALCLPISMDDEKRPLLHNSRRNSTPVEPLANVFSPRRGRRSKTSRGPIVLPSSAGLDTEVYPVSPIEVLVTPPTPNEPHSPYLLAIEAEMLRPTTPAEAHNISIVITAPCDMDEDLETHGASDSDSSCQDHHLA